MRLAVKLLLVLAAAAPAFAFTRVVLGELVTSTN
jgi:hypothetical protein